MRARLKKPHYGGEEVGRGHQGELLGGSLPATLMDWGLGLGNLEAWVPAPAGRCGQEPEFLNSPFQLAGPPSTQAEASQWVR